MTTERIEQLLKRGDELGYENGMKRKRNIQKKINDEPGLSPSQWYPQTKVVDEERRVLLDDEPREWLALARTTAARQQPVLLRPGGSLGTPDN